VTRLGTAIPAELLDSAERLTREQLLDLQLERMRWSLRHAYTNVPHYRRAFDAAGVTPDDCSTLGLSLIHI